MASEKIKKSGAVKKLKRNITTIEAIFYGLGIIIGAGIYVLIAPASETAGNAVWMAFLIAATLATFTGLSYAELGSMFPKSAAEYVYIRRAYNSHLYAFIIGWLIMFTAILSISTVALGFTGYFADFIGVSLEQSVVIVPIISVALIALMSLVNYVGIKETSKTNVIMVSTVIVGLIVVIAVGVSDFDNFGSIDYFQMPFGFQGVFIAASLIFFAYLGFEEIVNIAEETKKPRKVIPRAIIMAVIISTALYILTALSVISILGWENVAASGAPLADAARVALGPIGGIALSGLALFATASTVLGLILVNSRMMWGMSKNGSLPKIFSKLGKRGTPYAALIATAIGASILVFMGDVGELASVTSMGSLFIFLSVNLVLIWLRYIRPDMVRPFKIPLNIGKYPLIAGIGVVISIFMLFQFNVDQVFIGVVVAGIGVVLFLIYKRRDRILEKEAKNIIDAIKEEAEK